jgi:hypothetical protein
MSCWGCWLILSPYPLGFVTDREALADTMAAGAIIVAFAGWEIYDVMRRGKT